MRWLNVLLLLWLYSATPLVAENRVLELDGQGSYMQLPGHIFDDLEEATVEAWVKWDEWGYFSQWFAFGTDVDAVEAGGRWRAMGSNHYDRAHTLQFFIYGPDGAAPHVLATEAEWPQGKWCHLAVVTGREGMRFYCNGVLVGQNEYAGGEWRQLPRGRTIISGVPTGETIPIFTANSTKYGYGPGRAVQRRFAQLCSGN